VTYQLSYKVTTNYNYQFYLGKQYKESMAGEGIGCPGAVCGPAS
jgi:hypothetical protein